MTYIVYVPRTGSDYKRVSEARFVSDSFCWAAALFAPVWCIVQRAWKALAIWLLAATGVTAAIIAGNLSLLPAIGLIVSFAVIFGSEARGLLQGALESRGLLAADLIVAPDREHAARLFVCRLKAALPQIDKPAIAPSQRGRADHRFGLFSDSGV